MSYTLQALKPRHHIILQYAFNGLNNKEIALKLGMSPVAIGCILRSPAATAEIARMRSIANEKTTDIPARVALHHELTGAAVESVRLNRALQRDPMTKTETRVKIATHFMDRVIFDKRNESDEREMSYRDLLRKIDKLEAKIEEPLAPLPVTETLPIQQVQDEVESPLTTSNVVVQSLPLTSEPRPHLELISSKPSSKRIIDVSDPD